MQYITYYDSPIGKLLLAADDIGLTGIWFEHQKYYALNLETEYQETETQLLINTKQWLDIYFSGEQPPFEIPLHFIGTRFQKQVWEILCTIPYGQTLTYGQIATILAKQLKVERMSAQAVGGAVARNNISIIVPCHRVIGANGMLTGYAAGVDKKIALLKLENCHINGNEK